VDFKEGEVVVLVGKTLKENAIVPTTAVVRKSKNGKLLLERDDRQWKWMDISGDNIVPVADVIKSISKRLVDSEDTAKKYSGHLTRGWLRYHAGDTFGALKDYDEAIQSDSLRDTLHIPYALRGHIFHDIGNETRALEDLDKAISQFGDFKDQLQHNRLASFSAGDR
jgi:hypothetical protein